MDASEEYWVVAEKLYHKVDKEAEKTGKCKAEKLPRATYKELREVFLPERTKQSVQKVGDKILQSALELFANSDLKDNATTPSCKAMGLEKLESDREEDAYCSFDPEAEEDGEHTLICDCPNGNVYYDAKSYAKEHFVKCKGKEATMHYSDNPEQLSKGTIHYQNAKAQGDVSGMVLALDEMVNAVHRSGALADLFVVGGLKTLERLANK